MISSVVIKNRFIKIIEFNLICLFYLESAFVIAMILFAGGWSDRNRRRKPCMLIPMLGEFAGYIGIS